MRRGDVHRLRVPKGLGREQQGPRYGVVVQADSFTLRSTLLIAPTSRSAREASFRPEVEVDGTATKVMVEQVGAYDPARLGRHVGHLSAEEMWSVDEALTVVLGLR